MHWPGHVISRVGRFPPLDHADSHRVRPQAQRVETEVTFQLVPQGLTDLGSASTGTESLKQRSEHAVVLILHIVSDADGIPLVEQTSQVILGGGTGSHRPRLPPTNNRFSTRPPDPDETP